MIGKESKIIDVLSDLEELESWKWEDLLAALDKIAIIVGYGTELLGKEYNGSYEEVIEQLKKENGELKSIKHFADAHGINIFNIDEAFRRCWNDNGKLEKENVRLKEQLTDANELNQIYVDYLIDNGFELSDVIEWSKRS